MNKKLLRKIQQFAQCSPKKRGRSVNTENIDQKKEEKQGNLCEQVTQKGKTVYYRTDQGKAKSTRSKLRQRRLKQKNRQAKLAEKAKKTAERKQNIKAKMFQKSIGDEDLSKKVKSGEIKSIKGVEQAKIDKILKENAELKKKLAAKEEGKPKKERNPTNRVKLLKKANDKLEREKYEYEQKIRELTARLKKLETGGGSEVSYQTTESPKTQRSNVDIYSPEALNATKDSLRHFYKANYRNHHGLYNLGDAFRDLERYTGLSREELKNQFLALKNEGEISLTESINIGDLKEDEIIREGRRHYFALKINDLMEF